VNNAPPGSLPASLPSGSGILLLGVDNITIKGNLIENNDFLGVAVVDWCVGVGLQGPSPIDCTSNPPIVEPAPDNNSIILNTFSGNGGAPPSGFEPFAADIVVLAGAGVNNCFHNNTPSASVFPPLPLPPCN
jgi:hypothetical protein